MNSDGTISDQAIQAAFTAFQSMELSHGRANADFTTTTTTTVPIPALTINADFSNPLGGTQSFSQPGSVPWTALSVHQWQNEIPHHSPRVGSYIYFNTHPEDPDV